MGRLYCILLYIIIMWMCFIHPVRLYALFILICFASCNSVCCQSVIKVLKSYRTFAWLRFFTKRGGVHIANITPPHFWRVPVYEAMRVRGHAYPCKRYRLLLVLHYISSWLKQICQSNFDKYVAKLFYIKQNFPLLGTPFISFNCHIIYAFSYITYPVFRSYLPQSIYSVTY